MKSCFASGWLMPCFPFAKNSKHFREEKQTHSKPNSLLLTHKHNRKKIGSRSFSFTIPKNLRTRGAKFLSLSAEQSTPHIPFKIEPPPPPTRPFEHFERTGRKSNVIPFQKARDFPGTLEVPHEVLVLILECADLSPLELCRIVLYPGVRLARAARDQSLWRKFSSIETQHFFKANQKEFRQRQRLRSQEQQAYLREISEAHKGQTLTEQRNECEQAILRFPKDLDFVLATVSRFGSLLQHAPLFRDNEQVVLAAVSNESLALQYASWRLSNDPLIVFTAIEQNIYDGAEESPMKFASEDAAARRELALFAVNANKQVMKWIAKILKSDPEILAVFHSRCKS